MEVHLRKAQQADVDDIAQIHVSSWENAFDGLMPARYIHGYTHSSRVDEWQGIIRTNVETVVVAERESKVVGFMSYSVHSKHDGIIELSKLYLCPSVYGLGLGYKLMSYLERESQELGMKTISLYVLDNNVSAIQFYSKQGFQLSGGHVSEEFEGTTIIDVQMIKRV
ncbi:GNAT family N-acetyltransferase [Vibrio makurazakiensis]|uniref:GNAT family N-acetyltransferase n=1 Tax=Vibrio makurazakiensis TaxID=2910250 RepID=UPI003D0EB5E7